MVENVFFNNGIWDAVVFTVSQNLMKSINMYIEYDETEYKLWILIFKFELKRKST